MAIGLACVLQEIADSILQVPAITKFCLSVVVLAGRFVASNEMDSAMVYEYKTGTGFRMLQADSSSRPVTHSSAIQHPIPCQATVGAIDRQGRAIFLAPEPESFGPERNMYTAVQYYLGQTPAGIVQGNLRQAGRDDTGGSATRAAGCSSSSHQEGALMSLSALPSAEACPMNVEGAGVGSATDPPETTGRPEGDLAHFGVLRLQKLHWHKSGFQAFFHAAKAMPSNTELVSKFCLRFLPFCFLRTCVNLNVSPDLYAHLFAAPEM